LPGEAPRPVRGRRLPKRAKDLALLAAWTVHGLDGPEDAPPVPGR
jgi:hypothetical protein